MDVYTALWLAWAAGFVLIEAPALFNKRSGDTLSEHLRAWFATKTKPGGWQFRRAGLAVFFVWLIFHLFIDGPGPL